jgi:hypothetical protein
MADNKATALKDAKSNIKIKVYYSGETPAECGVEEWEYNLEPLGGKNTPWLFKYYPDKDQKNCAQFVNSLAMYRSISRGLAEILDAVIVNAKQREALDKLVDHLLWGRLGNDNANENDGILY